MIRTFICSVFLHRFLVTIGLTKPAKAIFLSYLLLLLAFDLFILVDISFM